MRARTGSFFKYLFLIAVSLFSVFPLYWMAVSATNNSQTVLSGTLLPGPHLFENYKNLVGQPKRMAGAEKFVCVFYLADSLVPCDLLAGRLRF